MDGTEEEREFGFEIFPALCSESDSVRTIVGPLDDSFGLYGVHIYIFRVDFTITII